MKYKKLSEIEWDNIKLNYITRPDNPSLQKLSNEFHVAFRTLQLKASVKNNNDENWNEEKQKFRTSLQKSIQNDVSKSIIDEIKKRRLDYINTIDSWINRSMNKISKKFKSNNNMGFNLKEIESMVKLREFLLGHGDNSKTSVGSLTINLNKPIEEMNEKERELLEGELDKIKTGNIEDAQFVVVDEK